MTDSDTSDIPVRPDAIEALGELLKRHQAGIQIDYLYDHGWQVGLCNPGGSLYVHAHDYPNKLSPGFQGEELSLVDTIAKATTKARQEGWW
jgi:hypothetical protein